MDWIYILTSVLILTTAEGASNLKCYGEFFNDRLCTSPNYIDIQSADYGVSDTSGSQVCDPNHKMCQQDIETFDVVYYNEIKTQCNGKESCDGLRANWAIIPNCGELSDYVEIVYVCLRDGSTVTTPPTTTTVTTITTTSSSASTTTAGTVTTTSPSDSTAEDDDDPGSGGLSGGTIAGIVIGVLLGLTVAGGAVVLFILCRRDPDLAIRTKTTLTKPFNTLKSEKKEKRADSSSSDGTTEAAPDILRHPHINGYSKPKIQHENDKMNRDTSCRSGVGPEIVLTPQAAGAKPPLTMDSLHLPKPGIEIVSTPQEAIRRTKNMLPYSPELADSDDENPYEFYEEFYDEFNDNEENEYAEIPDYERNDQTRIKKPSIKQKPTVPNTEGKRVVSLSEDIMNHLQKRKDLLNKSGENTARSSTVEMAENDDLYYNSGEVDPEYELAQQVDDSNAYEGEGDNRYYDLQPKNNQQSRKYEHLRYDDNPAGHPEAPNKRMSQYDDGEYYDDDEWSDGSADDYMGDQAVRPSALAAQDGHGKKYNRKISSTEC